MHTQMTDKNCCPEPDLNHDRKYRLRQRQGFGTLEVVIIIAVLLSVALVFRSALTDYAHNLIQTVLGDQEVIDDLAVE